MEIVVSFVISFSLIFILYLILVVFNKKARKKLKIGNHISECCNKVYGYKKCGGYEWRYADE